MSVATGQHPKVFVSYSWDNQQHREWVREFAARLRHDGVNVTLDQWHAQPGDQLTMFMESAVRENDFVLIVCTPRYKQKSDDRAGGVGYEGNIMTGEVFTGTTERKFIPILRQGAWKDAAPSWLLGKYYIDLTDGPVAETNYYDLLLTLYDKRQKAPPVGPILDSLKQFSHHGDIAVLDTGRNLTGWDRGSLPRFSADYDELKNRLVKLGMSPLESDLCDFSLKTLQLYRQVVLVCPKDCYLTKAHCDQLAQYVRLGNSLLILAYYWWKVDHDTNLGDLTQRFGIVLRDDRVFAPSDYYQHEYQPMCTAPVIATNLLEPITAPFCCSMQITQNVEAILTTREPAISQEVTLVDRRVARKYQDVLHDQLIIGARAPIGRGKVVVLGSWEIILDGQLKDKTLGNSSFTDGVLKWLINK